VKLTPSISAGTGIEAPKAMQTMYSPAPLEKKPTVSKEGKVVKVMVVEQEKDNGADIDIFGFGD
jgi:hypothetical protein